jgi:hypothetical protein
MSSLLVIFVIYRASEAVMADLVLKGVKGACHLTLVVTATIVRSRSGFNLRTNSIAAAKTFKVLRNEKTKDREQKEKKTAGTGAT